MQERLISVTSSTWVRKGLDHFFAVVVVVVKNVYWSWQ
jgi:hypothetical protein